MKNVVTTSDVYGVVCQFAFKGIFHKETYWFVLKQFSH